MRINLNDTARSGKLDPVIGRDDEIRRILQILTRRTKNNPILIGEPGVGKTAIAEGMAHRIIGEMFRKTLNQKSFILLIWELLLQEQNIKVNLRKGLNQLSMRLLVSNGEIILFIDEIHTLVGAGKSKARWMLQIF